MLAKRVSARDNHGLACNIGKLLQIKKKFHSQTQEYTFLNLAINNPPHLKYVVTLPCNLSLITCFADINVSQGSVATYARCSGNFDAV